MLGVHWVFYPMNPLTLLVVSKPDYGFLRYLEDLPEETHIVVGNEVDMFREAAAKADVLLNVMSPLELVRNVWNLSPKLRWMHSFSAGVENSLFPELVASNVPLTNGRGVFSRSLGEFAMCGALYFTKKIPLMRKQQQEGRWENIDEVWELAGTTMGIVGYGTIGEWCARLARPFGMRVLAYRRRPDTIGDGLVDRTYGPGELGDMMAESDFVVVTLPITPETRGLVGDAEIRRMKPSAVLINVGRGPVVSESALAAALREGRIRGAALDVFDREPLPAGHPFYSMDNVLLSPHSADHTPGWTDNAMKFFVSNFRRFHAGQPLENLVDKGAGY